MLVACTRNQRRRLRSGFGALDGRPPGWVREHESGPYRLDFYCPPVRLAVEVDGGSHYGLRRAAHDETRDLWHMRRDVATMRISARHVMEDLPGVLRLIDDQVVARANALRVQLPVRPLADRSVRQQFRSFRRPRLEAAARRPLRRRRRESPVAVLVRLALVLVGMWLLLHVLATHSTAHP